MNRENIEIATEIEKTVGSQESVRLPDGTRLISPSPEIAPNAWRHILFHPISYEEIKAMESSLGHSLPEQIKRFLTHYNGASFFNRQICVWGKRRSWERNIEQSWQPFDLVDHNRTNERPIGSPDSVIFFGSANRGDDWVFADMSNPGTDQIGQTTRELFAPIRNWPDFNNWLKTELGRLDER